MAVTLDKGKAGPIQWEVSSRSSDLDMFSKKERNTIIRTAMTQAGEYWQAVFLPLRFSNYAYSLGYYVSAKWAKLKKKRLGKVIPYVGFTPSSGFKMVIVALRDSRALSTAAAARFLIIIKVPFGHPVRPETTESFTTTPANEVTRMSVQVAKNLDALIRGSRMTMRRRGPLRTLDGSVSRIADGKTIVPRGTK